MEIHRRTFMARLGGAAAVSLVGSKPRAQQDAGLLALDPRAFRDRANADGEFGATARFWNAHVRMDIGETSFDAFIREGRLAEFAPSTGAGDPDVRIAGPAEIWTAVPGAGPATAQGFQSSSLRIEGDTVGHIWPYQRAILRLVALVRETFIGPTTVGLVEDVDRAFDSAVGRYAYVRIQGVQYRVYYEEAGQGIPIVLQHTAGADGRQWRHLLEDRELQQQYRMIAYDLPYHGKSLPPTGVAWWTQEYRLTTELLMDSVVAMSHALKLDRPIYMGCSVGGYLAPDLALYRPDEFRAVVGINSGLGSGRSGQNREPARTLGNSHQNNAYFGARMYMITSSVAPEPFRRETGWVYSQGGPGVFAGDIYYYSVDHDLTGGRAKGIDTSKIGVHFLTGEYDPEVSGPNGTAALVADIPGCTYDIIKGGSHFAMCDNYPLFRQYLMPVLDRIHATRVG